MNQFIRKLDLISMNFLFLQIHDYGKDILKKYMKTFFFSHYTM